MTANSDDYEDWNWEDGEENEELEENEQGWFNRDNSGDNVYGEPKLYKEEFIRNLESTSINDLNGLIRTVEYVDDAAGSKYTAKALQAMIALNKKDLSVLQGDQLKQELYVLFLVQSRALPYVISHVDSLSHSYLQGIVPQIMNLWESHGYAHDAKLIGRALYVGIGALRKSRELDQEIIPLEERSIEKSVLNCPRCHTFLDLDYFISNNLANRYLKAIDNLPCQRCKGGANTSLSANRNLLMLWELDKPDKAEEVYKDDTKEDKPPTYPNHFAYSHRALQGRFDEALRLFSIGISKAYQILSQRNILYLNGNAALMFSLMEQEGIEKVALHIPSEVPYSQQFQEEYSVTQLKEATTKEAYAIAQKLEHQMEEKILTEMIDRMLALSSKRT